MHTSNDDLLDFTTGGKPANPLAITIHHKDVSCIIAKVDYSQYIFGSKHDINVANECTAEKHSSSLSSTLAYIHTTLYSLNSLHAPTQQKHFTAAE